MVQLAGINRGHFGYRPSPTFVLMTVHSIFAATSRSCLREVVSRPSPSSCFKVVRSEPKFHTTTHLFRLRLERLSRRLSPNRDGISQDYPEIRQEASYFSIIHSTRDRAVPIWAASFAMEPRGQYPNDDRSDCPAWLHWCVAAELRRSYRRSAPRSQALGRDFFFKQKTAYEIST